MDDVPCTYRVSVKAIIKDDQGRTLLLREADGSWDLPGGGLDQGEKPREALGREIKEEIGCTVDWMSDGPVAFWTTRRESASPTLKWFSFVAYEAKISGDIKLDINEEAEEARYCTDDEARELKLHDNLKPYLAR